MPDRWIHTDILYTEFVMGTHLRGKPEFHFTDVCKRDMKPAEIESWEMTVEDWVKRKYSVTEGVKVGEVQSWKR